MFASLAMEHIYDHPSARKVTLRDIAILVDTQIQQHKKARNSYIIIGNC